MQLLTFWPAVDGELMAALRARVITHQDAYFARPLHDATESAAAAEGRGARTGGSGSLGKWAGHSA